MAHKVNLEIAGVVENMSGFTTPGGERFPIFGEGGGQELADELDVPLLGKVPLTMPLREQADAGVPLVVTDPDDPAAQAIRQAARGLIAMAPPPALPLLASARSAERCRTAGPPDAGVASRWPARAASAYDPAPRRTGARGPAAGGGRSARSGSAAPTPGGRRPSRSCRPEAALGRPNAVRQAVTPTTATSRGCQRAHERLQRRRAGRAAPRGQLGRRARRAVGEVRDADAVARQLAVLVGASAAAA